jgi:glycosyltransferase involved in cell wall biosynthesis
MNIACDIRVFLSAETGVGTYYKNLLNQLAVSDRKNRYLLFSSSWKQRFPIAKIPGFIDRRLLDARIPVKLLNCLWYQWQYPPLEYFFREKIAIAHSPTPMLLPCRGKKIITIHDLFFITNQQLVQPESRRHFCLQLSKNVSMADGIICVSQSTRSQLLDMFPAAAAKTRVIYHGVAPYFFADNCRPVELRKKYLLPDKFVLFIGTIEPRKNLPALLQALLKLKQTGIVIPLVIAGSRGWGTGEFLALEKELGSQIHEIGYVDDADLPFLYHEAQLFIFPSLAEGFGLPLLESLASGTPVLCSDIPVFHEIGHALPTYFKTTDISDLAEKIGVLWKQNKEISRDMRIAHARNFSWQNTAVQTLAFYQQLTQGQA